MVIAVFLHLSTVCQYIKLYRLWFCATMANAAFYNLYPVCQLHIPSLNSKSLWPMLPSAASSFSVSYTYRLLLLLYFDDCCHPHSDHCPQYLTLYRLLALWHSIHCCVLQSAHCLSITHTVPCLGSVSLWPMLSSTDCPMSVIDPVPSILCNYIKCCLLQSVHCMSIPHNVPFVGSFPLRPFLSSSVSPPSVSTSHCNVSIFCTTLTNADF